MKQILEGSQESRGMSLMKRIHNKHTNNIGKWNRNEGIHMYVYDRSMNMCFELEGRFNAPKYHVFITCR